MGVGGGESKGLYIATAVLEFLCSLAADTLTLFWVHSQLVEFRI